MKTYWVSLANDDGTARVVLFDGADEIVARVKTHAARLYRKGDQLLILEIPPHMPEHQLPRNRVLTEEELQSVDASTVGEEVDAGRWP